jgi:hypothetical protein
MAELQLTVGNLLGGVYHTQLGQYGRRYFRDNRVALFLAEFQAELEDVENEIKQRNNPGRQGALSLSPALGDPPKYQYIAVSLNLGRSL